MLKSYRCRSDRALAAMIPGGQAPVSGRGPPLWSHGVWEQGPETVPRQAARIPGWRGGPVLPCRTAMDGNVPASRP